MDVKLIQLADEVKRLSRRFDDLGKTIDTLTNDREIFEDILTRLTAVESALHLQRASQTEMVKDIKSDIGDVQSAVEAKMDEAAVAMDENTLIVKSPTKSVIEKIIDKVKGVSI